MTIKSNREGITKLFLPESYNWKIYGAMNAPYPWEDLEEPCSTSWMWPDAKDKLKDHKKHIIVSWLSRSEDQILKSTIVSKLTVSVLEEINGIG